MTTGAKLATELGIPIDDEPTTYPERAEKVVREGSSMSDEPKFTPGEWHIDSAFGEYDDVWIRATAYQEDDKNLFPALAVINCFHPNHAFLGREETDANANLIARAPKMYALIAEFIRWVDDTNGNDKSQLLTLYEDAKSELAKARGEQA